MANLTGGLVNYLTYAWLVSQFPVVRENPVLGVAAGAIAGLSVNFTLSKMLVFRGKPRETYRQTGKSPTAWFTEPVSLYERITMSAIRIRCTSSEPSAMRAQRAPINICASGVSFE